MTGDDPASNRAAGAPAWRLELWGPPRLVRTVAGSEHDSEFLLHGHERAWVAVIAAGNRLSTQQIAEIVWPESEAALNALRTSRKRLEARFRGRLQSTLPLVALGTHPRLVGVAYAEPNAQEFVGRSGPWPKIWLEGLDPDAVSTKFSDWSTRKQVGFIERCTSPLLDLADRAEGSSKIEEALHHAVAVTRIDPRSERGTRLAMRLSYQLGRTSEAVDSFERLERALRDSARPRPSADTVELMRRIEAGQLPRAPVHALDSRARLRRPPRLVGRDAELASLRQMLAQGLIPVLSGPSGIGKSRLLETLAEGYGDSALMVTARSTDEDRPFAVAQRVLSALDPAAAKVSDAIWRTSVRRALNDAFDAGKRLLIIDNLQFSDAATLELIQFLFGGQTVHGVALCLSEAADEEPRTLSRSKDRVLKGLLPGARFKCFPIGELDSDSYVE